MYDYGARMYMPDIGRFGMFDPLAEKTMEPYSYVYNNPIKFIDPTGMEGETAASDTSETGGGNSTGGESSVAGGTQKKEQRQQREPVMIDIGYGIKVGSGSSAISSYDFSGSSGSDSTGRQRLDNPSDHSIYFKPEITMTIDGKEYKNDGSYELKSGQSWEHGFDGIAAPHLSKDSVFKVNNGVSATVTNEGIFTYGTDLKSIMAAVASEYISHDKLGGWKSAEWGSKNSAHSVTTSNYSWKTGGKTSTSVSQKIADKTWTNLFIKAGVKNAQNFSQPHTYNVNHYGW